MTRATCAHDNAWFDGSLCCYSFVASTIVDLSFFPPSLTNSGDPLHSKGTGKRYSTDKIKTTGWKPKYASFDDFCEANK
jgi:hypothetical protein